MTLRGKLLLAQVPMLVALVLLSALTLSSVSSIGGSAQDILRENYRSVLAAQRMKEAVERMDSGALFLVAGQRDKGLAQIAAYRGRFEAELRIEEANITERGEAELARRLRGAWTAYQQRFEAFAREEDPAALRRAYFAGLEPAFLAVKNAADEVLAMNQDAMVRKSERARRVAQRLSQIAVTSSVGAVLLGILASMLLVARLLLPLQQLRQAAERLGQGDVDARAQIRGRDELSRLAQDFNAMADRIKRYRTSSLGELLQAQHAAQSAIDSIPDPVLVFDTAGGLLHVNQAAEVMLGADAEAQGAEPLARLAPAVREVIQRVRAHVLAGRGAYVPRDFSEAVGVPAADGERSLLPRATPVYGEQGSVQGATVILQDVTRLRRFDELKDDLVATVAHEFRTPLTSLRMAVHLCLEEVAGPLTEKQADLLGAAREDCQRLQGIVDDLLDLARLQAGRIEMRKLSLSVANLVEEAVAEQQALAAQRGVTLQAEVSPLGPEHLVADRERLGLVFANLIGNALRHTPAGGTVTVRALPADAGATLRFEVQDTGEGIPPEYQQAIFSRFFRVPGRAGGGAGLGLSIAKEIVEAHGGAIGVQSQPDKGSTFYFMLPTRGQP